MKRVRVWSTVGVIGLAMIASAAAPPGRFVVNAAAGTVRDGTTNLTWQRTVSGTYTWAQATTYCQGLNLGGFSTGWRLPTKKELETLVDFRVVSPAIDVTAFPGTPAGIFWFWWTSTPYAGSSGVAWYVNFYDGFSYYVGTTNTYRVRCVR
jgi:hypothetical protein